MGIMDDARKRADARERASGNGRSTAAAATLPLLPNIQARDVATIDDLIRAGSQVRWLWEGWIPSAVLTAIAGLAGIGKTRFCADLIRRMRHGMPWPDGKPPSTDPKSLALWVVADNHHDQLVELARTFDIKPSLRLNASKTDPYCGVTLDTPDDYGELEARIKVIRPALVIVDTVGNATDRNLSRQEDAKAFYQPLQILARRYATAILCLTHLNAAGQFLGRRVLEKVRVAIRIEHPDGQKRLRIEVPKSFSKRPPAIGATMQDRGFDYDDHPPARTEDIERPGPVPAKLRETVDWLQDFLANGPKRVSTTRDCAGTKGFATGTLYRAKTVLELEEYDSQGYKWWRLRTEDELPD